MMIEHSATTEIEAKPDKIWAIITKSVSDGVDSWSHWAHGPDNNPLSQDEIIRFPDMTQWLMF